jgi:hypothetical protein
MDQRRAVKKTFQNKPEGRMGMGGPRLRLPEDLENDLREPKLKRPRQKANIREEWTCVVTGAQDVKGP